MRFADSFRAARWVRLINLILQALLFVSLFAGLNYIALRHTWRFELSGAALSPETTSYLSQLEKPVHIIVTITNDPDVPELAQAYRDISAILREYTYNARNKQGPITVEFLDVYKNRKKAEDYHLDEMPNVVLVLCGEAGRRQLMPSDFYQTKKSGKEYTREAFKGESTLTAAILDVSSSSKKKIYFLKGHGELNPDDVTPRGLSMLSDNLAVRNFEISTLELAQTRKVPDDAALLIIAGQQVPYQAFEQERLRDYLQTRAGRIIFMIDPWRAHGLENMIFDWGVIVYDKQIYDTSSQDQDEYGNLHLRAYVAHPITQTLSSNELPVVIGPARVVSEDIGRAKDDGLTVSTLIKTSPSAWGETSYRLRNIKPEYTYGEDLRLKDGLGVLTISERLKPANNLPLSIRGGRLAVFGTSDLVTNNRINNDGNLLLFLNTVNWAVDRDIQLNIPARTIQRFQLALSQEQLERLRLGLLFIVPGAVALLGFFVYWTRRH